MRHLALIALAACTPSLHDQQVQSAKEAQAKGDIPNAAIWWDAACKSKPDDTEACRAAAKVGDQLAQQSVAKAAPVCESGNIDACAAALRDIRRIRPNDAGLLSVLQKGELAYRKKCEALESPTSIDSTLRRAVCMIAATPTVADAGFDMMAQEERDHAAQVVAAVAGSKSPAARYAMFRTAQCLSKKVEPGSHVDAAAVELLQRALPISVRVRSGGPTPLSADTLSPCAAVQKMMGARSRCVDSSPERDLAVDVTATLGRIDHHVSQEIQVARYQSGVESYPNPERPSAEAEADRTQRSLDEIEQETRDRESQCQRTNTPEDCDRYHSIQSTYDSRRADRDRARQRLMDTPTTLERPVYSEVPYTIHHHTWSALYQIDGRTLAGDAIRTTNTIHFEDTEHPGVAPAGIAEDPLEAPRVEDFDRQVRTALVESAGPPLQRAFEKRATCADKPWSFDTPELECRTVSELYVKGPLPDPTAWLGAAVRCQ